MLSAPDPVTPTESVPSARWSWARLLDLILTADYKQRRCIKVLGLTTIVTATCVGIMIYGAHLDMFPVGPVIWIGAAVALSTVTFYTWFRTGWNRLMAEPTLTFPQMVVGHTLIAAGYCFSGPVHAGAMVVIPLASMFGMFNMHKRGSRAAAAYGLTVMGAAVLWRTTTDPLVYQWRIELVYYIFILVGLPMISVLSLQLLSMRERLKSQKIALERALVHIQEMATHDELTGLTNRRHMISLLREHAQRQSRGGPPFYIGMIDLDHFKNVNDTYGHAVGDDALRAFAKQARFVLRNTDIIARWGGEEFLLLLPETPPGYPAVGIERLRTSFNEVQVSDTAPDLRVHFSCGLSRYCDGEAIEQAVERADRAVYAAKEGGRDRVVVIEGPCTEDAANSPLTAQPNVA
jgi:diguanylate cyclase (GGDEF)-like protein